jgi:hypothetical protein
MIKHALLQKCFELKREHDRLFVLLSEMIKDHRTLLELREDFGRERQLIDEMLKATREKADALAFMMGKSHAEQN